MCARKSDHCRKHPNICLFRLEEYFFNNNVGKFMTLKVFDSVRM